MVETSATIQALCYILGKVKKADKLKLVKLLFLADKYHLVQYGRTITNDDYWAMSYGPVGSTAKDVLSLDPDFLSKEEYKYAAERLKRVGKHTFISGKKCAPETLDMLSGSDIEILDFVIDKFGKMSKWGLIEYTHRYPEWAQYKALFEKNLTRRERIRPVELLSLLEDDKLAVSEEHIQESREILTGTYD
jgi:uncharacterized phage-associated protein